MMLGFGMAQPMMMGQFQQRPNMPMQQMQPIPGFADMNLQPKPKRDYSSAICLYVGNLTATTFDNDLFKFFKSKGYKIKSAHVMIDKKTNKSQCFGYLNFYSQDEADKCLNEQNNAIIDGKQIVLNKKKESDFDSQANVLVKNLPKEMAQNNLFDLAKPYGKIISCKLQVNSDLSSKGFGYIQYDSKEAAQAAINKLNGSVQMGKEIQALIHQQKTERGEAGEHFTNLFVKNIPTNYTEDQLRNLFQQFGEI